MNTPCEGSRDISDGIIVSITPDVCKTPVGSSMVPIPYSITAKQADDANTVATVRFTKKRAHNMASLVTKCTGDAPGTGTGIKSGTVGSICHPKSHSNNVRIKGEWAIRDGDTWYMNNKNTVGKLVYVKSKQTFEETPAILLSQKPDSLLPEGAENSDMVNAILGGMERARKEGLPAGSYQVAAATTAVAVPSPQPAPGIPANNPRSPNRIPRPPAKIIQFPRTPKPIAPTRIPVGAISRSLARVLGVAVAILWPSTLGDGTLGPFMPYITDDPVEFSIAQEAKNLLDQNAGDAEWYQDVEEWFFKELHAYRQAKEQARSEEKNTQAESKVTPGNVRVEEDKRRRDPCNVQRYGSIQCAAGEQAHHIVPDSVLRYGNRAEGKAGVKRIPGMPTFRDGMAICLTGGHPDPTGASEHSRAHRITDNAIKVAGDVGNPVGTTTLTTAKLAGIAGASAAKPHCIVQITAAVEAQYDGMDGNRLVNAVNRPATGAALEALKAGN